MTFPISIGRTSLFQILGVLGLIFIVKNIVYANSGDPDLRRQIWVCAVCLSMSHKKDSRRIWVT